MAAPYLVGWIPLTEPVILARHNYRTRQTMYGSEHRKDSNMKKGFLLTSLLASSLVIAPMSQAAACESGMKSSSAYAKMLSFKPLIVSLLEAPDRVNNASSQAELQDAVKRLDSNLSAVSGLKSHAGCVSPKYNQLLSRDLNTSYEFKTAEEMIDKALKSADEAKALYPLAEARIEQASAARQVELAKAQKQNQLMQEKLKQEQQQIAQLEEAARKQRELEAQLAAAEQKRIELESRKSKPTTGSSGTTEYIAKPPGSSSFNSGLNNTRAGDGYIKRNRVICFSKSAHDRQIEMLVDGIKEYAPGCFSTPENQNAWMRDFSWNGECVVQRVSDNKRIWTDCGDFSYW